MNSTEQILIQILARIQLRIMAKRQAGLIKNGLVYQNKSEAISQKADECLIEAKNLDTSLQNVDDVSR